MGAVMGSKNLKAVAVRGTKGVAVRDPQAFMKAVAEGRAKLDPSPATKMFTDGGTLPEAPSAEEIDHSVALTDGMLDERDDSDE
jgi:aldehyde:ferredoxin oxidoreductase